MPRPYLLPALLLSLLLPQAPAADGFLLVTNKGDQTLSIIDGATHRQVAAVPEEGVTGHEVCASPDGTRAFVPIFGTGGVGSPGVFGQLIRVIDIAKRQITGTIDLGKPVRPHCPVYNEATDRLYVTTEAEDTITIIDPKTLTVLGTVPTGAPQSHMLAVSRDGKRGYTSNVNPGSVSVLDLEARKVVTVIPVSPRAQRISLSVDDKFAFTADQTQDRLAVIDTATNTVKQWVDLPGIAYGTAPTPDGKHLVVALINLSEVGLIDLATMKLVKTVPVPRAPQAIVVRPDGKYAYASCDAKAQVAAIRLSDFVVETLIDAGKTADGMAWAGK